MPSILVVTGSVRPNSAGANVLPHVVSELEKQGATVSVADVKEMNLPFFDDEKSPSTPGFESAHESVREWTRRVGDADGVLLLTPEYNHTMSPVQMNAIDWIGKEWADKPVAFVGYGWNSGALQAQATAREALTAVLTARVIDTHTNLFMMKELNPDGTALDAEAVSGKIAGTVTALLEEVAGK